MAQNVSLEQDQLREKVVEVARRHKASWIELGQYLHTIQKNKIYKYWGYLEFDNYCTKELGIKPLTALKMTRSYLSAYAENPGCEAGDECVGRTLRSSAVKGRAKEGSRTASADSAEIRKTRRNAAIKRLISVLTNARKELQHEKLLPAYILNQIDELSAKLQDQLEQ